MFTYPKVLRKKDIKRINNYGCSDEIKEAYLKFLTNYSFEEFVSFCEQNSQMEFEDIIFKFTDSQLDKFEPNSIIWISHVLLNFIIYFNVNLNYGNNYDAYASALQLTVLSLAMDMLINKIDFEELDIPQYSRICFKEFFEKCPDFNFNLKADCDLAYKSFNQNFDFTSDEFFQKIKNHFEKNGYV